MALLASNKARQSLISNALNLLTLPYFEKMNPLCVITNRRETLSYKNCKSNVHTQNFLVCEWHALTILYFR
jgi:hypothetical protein